MVPQVLFVVVLCFFLASVLVIMLLVVLRPATDNKAGGPPSPPASSASEPPASGGSASPTTSASAPAAASPTQSSAPAGPGVPNGTQLGAYTFNLSDQQCAPLNNTAPTQTQILACTVGDVSYDAGASAISASGPGAKIAVLLVSQTTTYQACATDTIFENSATDGIGSAFCIIEPDGRLIGVTVVSNDSELSYVELKVVIWQDRYSSPDAG